MRGLTVSNAEHTGRIRSTSVWMGKNNSVNPEKPWLTANKKVSLWLLTILECLKRATVRPFFEEQSLFPNEGV